MTTGMVFCRACGKQIHSTASSCSHCGAPQNIGRGKNKIVAGVLAIVVGSLGIHRFYLGQWWGIFYLLFFWTFIPGAIAFIEGIVFLVSSDERWNQKYNQGALSQGGDPAVLVIAIVGGVLVLVAVIGILAAIAIPQFAAYRRRAYMEEVRAGLKNAVVAQETFFAEQTRYKSCASCTDVDLPGYQKSPRVTLNAEATGKQFTLTATHENCGGAVWTYQSATGEITDPPDGCR